MPTSGDFTFSGFGPDPVMSPSAVPYSEFMSEDMFGVDGGDTEALQGLGPTLGDPKTLLASAGEPGSKLPTGGPGFSPPSHRGSSSSGSSERSATSNSAKTSHSSSGDAVMAEDIQMDWKEADHMTNGNGIPFGDPLDTSIDPSSHFNDNNFFDFDSASASSSPPMADARSSLSPEDLSMNMDGRSSSAKRPRTHDQAPSNPLTQPMTGLLGVNGVRDVTPEFASAESSPAAMIKHSPAHEHHSDFLDTSSFGGFSGAQEWPMNFQPNNMAFQAPSPGPQTRPDSKGLPTPNAGLAAYNSQAASIFNGNQPKLVIQPTPLKSRVETQIPIKLVMYNLPAGIKRLHLPLHTISKAKLLAKQGNERSPDMLELYTMLVCTSAMQDPEKRKKALKRASIATRPNSPEDAPENEEIKPQDGGEVMICQGCIVREKKRAGRKKNKKPEEEKLWDTYQNHRAIVFNTQEVKEWQPAPDPSGVGMSHFLPPGMQVDVPMRIACYCRHHGEKSGFQVVFTLKDYQDRVVVQEMSSSIMITDDHKTHLPVNTANNFAASPPESANVQKPLNAPLAFRHTQSTSDLQNLQRNAYASYQAPPPIAGGSSGTSVTATPRNLSRQGSPAANSGPASKKRKASGSAKVPTELAMTRLENTQPLAIPPSAQSDASVVSSATSPFSPNMNFPIAPNSFFPQGNQPGLNTMPQPFATGPPTPNGSDQILFPGGQRAMSIDNLGMAPSLFSAPASARQSRAASPSHMRTDMSNLQPGQMAPNVFAAPMGVSSASSGRSPLIHKIIPSEGPRSGGIEVTILGNGFTNGGLEVMFGDQRATTTTFWGETSLVCLLPPSPVTGPVPVTIKQPGMVPDQPTFIGKHQPMFRYVDDNEEQLMRTALAVLGHKIGGNMQDVADIARSIISGQPAQSSWGSSMTPSSHGPGGFSYNFEHPPAHSLESGLLRILELIDLDDSATKAKINLRRSSTGQTMLHLACALGMIRFVAGLLSRGANAGARDKGGFTPLHFAALNDHPEIVRRLILSGADPTMRSLSGFTPADLARSRDVLRALRRVETHMRSRSSGSLHSRVSSATSLRSLWDPPAMTSIRQDFESDTTNEVDSDSSYVDSSEEEAEDEENEWVDMRRASVSRSHQLSEITPPPSTIPAADVAERAASPTATITALREQFATQIQQLQHSMAMHLQNIQQQFQMPQMPQFSGMDYHNYLNNAPPVMQRIASLVPNIGGGSRPGSSGEQPKEGDKPWWELLSFGNKELPPPAYEDIFPQKDLDVKQATAAAAAAEYEADAKCTALYDQVTSESSKTREVPALLQIGRKNAITREQQENLQRAHAQKLKTIRSDRMLWFVWIPLLVLILGAMAYSGAPAFYSGCVTFVKMVISLVNAPREALCMDDAAVPVAPAVHEARVHEIL